MGCGQSKQEDQDPMSPTNKGVKLGPVVRCSHVLVKHTMSRTPVSNRTGQTITASPYSARTEAQALLDNIIAGKITFEEAAKTKSDCSTFAKDGDLGEFERGAMLKPFSDAAFCLDIGEISGVISTKSGLHIIKRTG